MTTRNTPKQRLERAQEHHLNLKKQNTNPQSSSSPFLLSLEQGAIAKAEVQYKTQPHWLIKDAQGKTLFHLERKTGLRYPHNKRPQDVMGEWNTKLKTSAFWELASDYSLNNHKGEWNTKLKTSAFWELASDYSLNNHKVARKSDTPTVILDTAQGWVWHWFKDLGEKTAAQATTALANSTYIGLSAWMLAKKASLIAFRDKPGNPARNGIDYYFYKLEYWLCSEGLMSFSEKNSDTYSLETAFIMAYHTQPNDNPVAFWALMHQQGMKVANISADALLDIPDFGRFQNTDWKGLSFARLWGELMREGWRLEAEDKADAIIQPTQWMQQSLLDIDYTPCRLPPLEPIQLTDPNKGLWELWGENEAQLHNFGLRARNPTQDVREEWVAIDFGTSSTVVAVSTPSGGKSLLRVGVRDFRAVVQPKDYENPTALEFLDLDNFLAVWNSQVYRPALDWGWVKAAHEALNDFRDHGKDSNVVKRVLLYLKRWVMESERVVHRITDQSGREYVLKPMTASFPVRGQTMNPRGNEPLDVIELYAWYLGMAINWRQRGVYLKYAMTFPVKYTQDVRSKILAAFSRGLQRSLPPSLLADSATMNSFEVRDIASEPMAYAVAVLPATEQPTTQGVAYAVFDFGGGTTDFDFGLWRMPTPEEVDEDGAESVFERLGAGGDPYLGGENLLALLAYQVFQNNIEEVQSKKLVFTRPDSELAFVGSEAVVDSSAVAQSNTAMLMQALRPLLEEPETFNASTLTMDMLDHIGKSPNVKLMLDVEALQDLLAERVKRGAEGFLSEMSAAFAEDAPGEIHILLAGNASRGKWVREAFNTESPAWAEWVRQYFGTTAPQFTVHLAVGADEAGVEAPNCKTSVALGALDLVPGSVFLKKDRLHDRSQGDAPFKYFVGPITQAQLHPVLEPASAYQQWHELGIVRDGVFVLAWSSSPRARSGMKKGDSEMRVRNVTLPGANKGYRCYGRAVSASAIELVAAASREALENQNQVIPTLIDLDA